ncbi:SIMPL domain-containing protein [Clostridium sp. DJ247]|uniref:SIMPL domain-containing protein n=1 Tax=Clostridium sp. DJ247 TaxID=2726188 RepID=UPI001625D676|nr:SIMPL domain-containing protein [Clostridium sp. DJ247]MBC2580447.1 SIMPL domain-containing protein [Clostridium sp. DJ247]
MKALGKDINFMMNYPYFNSNTVNIYNAQKGIIKINGTGIIKAEPNIAIVNIGIITENKSLETAQSENTTISLNVINELYRMNVTRNQISTASYSIEPQYDYIEGRQVFRAYRVTNTLNVKITDLKTIGQIIDSSVAKGANNVGNIRFTVENPSFYYNKALNSAIKEAVVKSRNIGNTLGVNLYETPYKIIEQSLIPTSEDSSMIKVFSASTPILPGEITFVARVDAYFKYF